VEHAGADAGSAEEEKESTGWTNMTCVAFFLWHFVGFGCNPITLTLFGVFYDIICYFIPLFYSVIFRNIIMSLMLDWMNAWMNDEKCMLEWMYERRIEKLEKIEVSASSGFLHRLSVS